MAMIRISGIPSTSGGYYGQGQSNQQPAPETHFYQPEEPKEKVTIVDFLIKNGVDVNSVDLLGKTPLHYAVTQNNPIVVLELINFGASLNAQDKEGNTPLDVAVSENNEAVVKILKRAGAT